MSRNMKMNGERRIRVEDISFESETFNIYDPFFTSESDMSSSGDSESDLLSDSNASGSGESGYGSENPSSAEDCYGSSYNSSEDVPRERDNHAYFSATMAAP